MITELIYEVVAVAIAIALYDWAIDPLLEGISRLIKKRRKKVAPKKEEKVEVKAPEAPVPPPA